MNRLKKVIRMILLQSQNAFVQANSLDVTLIVNEGINSRIKIPKVILACKLVIEKTYDHVNWKFLLSIMKI